MDLQKFLREREGEWWSPHQIHKEQGVDIRTVKKAIRDLDKMTHKGWKLVIAERFIAERGVRLWCVRLERDMENSGNLVKAKVSNVEVDRTRPQISSKKEQTLDNYFPI